MEEYTPKIFKEIYWLKDSLIRRFSTILSSCIHNKEVITLINVTTGWEDKMIIEERKDALNGLFMYTACDVRFSPLKRTFTIDKVIDIYKDDETYIVKIF